MEDRLLNRHPEPSLGWPRLGAAALIFCGTLFFAFRGGAADTRALPGHVPAAVAGLTPVDRLPAARQLHLAISLPLRNRESLTNLLQRLYDPASPSFHHFLDPEQFTAEFGPTEKDYQAVIAFAKASGFTILATHPNRALLEARASVADIEKAFHLSMEVYQHPTEHRTFYAPDAEPSLDREVPVLAVAGLNNYLAPHPASLHVSPLAPPHDPAPEGGSQPPFSAYIGLDFRSAYAPGVTNTGAGQSVGLVEFDAYYPVDVADYIADGNSGLTNVSTVLSNVVLGDMAGYPTRSGEVEVALDIDMSISMAPGLSSVYVYEAPNDVSYADVILNRMATDNLCEQLSCSWDGFTDAGVEQAFQEFAAQGQSFFQASGDSGAYLPVYNPVSPPCDDPNITIVGGTTLSTTGPQGDWISEKTWNWYSRPDTQLGETNNAGGGGVSPTYALPVWQEGVDMSANQGSTNFRDFPDVSMVADKIFVIADDGGTFIAGGTSASAPLWAGLTALVNEQHAALGQSPAGFLNPALYAIGGSTNYSSCFHDITVGNNTNYNASGNTNAENPNFTANFTNATLFFAAPGYDLCAGWGTPIASNLISVLTVSDPLGITPLTGFSTSGPLGGPFSAVSQSYTLTNLGTAPVSWSLPGLPSWLGASSTGGVLAPGQSAALTLWLNPVAAAGLPGGEYSTNVPILDLTDGASQIRFFTLTVVSPQLVQNGGFETGNFTGWASSSKFNLVASPDSTGVFNYNPAPATVAAYIYSGAYSALLGEPGSLAWLTQTVPTLPGQPYLISFWLSNPGLLSSGYVTPNAFQVQWNGADLFNQTNLNVFAWTNMQFVVSATNTTTSLVFGAQNDNDYFGLDDVGIQAIPAPSFVQAAWTNGSFNLSWTALDGLAYYQLEYSTNLPSANWVSLGGPVTATNGLITTTDLLPSNPQRFYRLLLLP
ncbi:MAG: protease pro-enzyme activation domain-containing protein [Verrucomicrobiota bacterium]